MPIYQVCGAVTVSCWTEVEANSKEEAIKIASKRDLAEINIDGTYPDSECWHIDTDGKPHDLRIDG